MIALSNFIWAPFFPTELTSEKIISTVQCAVAIFLLVVILLLQEVSEPL